MWLNPNWHELWRQEKCSSLSPPRGILYKTHWAWHSVKLTRLMSIFTSQKSLEIFDKKFSWQILIQKGQGVESALPHANKGFQLRGIYSNLSGEVNLLKPLIKNPFNYGKVWKENLPLAQSLNTYKHSCLPIISRFSFIFQVQFLSNYWEVRAGV